MGRLRVASTAAALAFPLALAGSAAAGPVQGSISTKDVRGQEIVFGDAAVVKDITVTVTANRITIPKTATLSAVGVTKATGLGAGETGGTLPGGGGSLLTMGGSGSFLDAGVCSTTGCGAGGAVVDMDALLGAARGGSPGGGSTGLPVGGAAGGHLILRAAQVEILGTIDVSAETFSGLGIAVGGGSGGVIEIYASEITGNGHIRADGGSAPNDAGMKFGGAGAGGVIYLSAAKISADLVLSVAGGASVATDDCMTQAIGGGADGTVVQKIDAKCIDADGDGAPSAFCTTGAKGDCDDSDPEIHPGAVEACDGKDNDCNEKVDDGADDACDEGEVCVDGMCGREVADAGPGAGGGGGSAKTQPDYIDFRGGCDFPGSGGGLVGVAAGMLVIAAAVAARARRR